MKSLSHVQLFATPRTVVCQAPPSMGFPRQEYWSGLPFPSPGNLLDSRMKPKSPIVQADSLPSKPPENYMLPFVCEYILLLFSRSVMSNSLRPHGLQHTRLSCPLSPRVCSNSCPLSQWCHPITSSSVIPFSCPQFFPNQGLFQWVISSHQVAKVLELQHQTFQWIFRVDFL